MPKIYHQGLESTQAICYQVGVSTQAICYQAGVSTQTICAQAGVSTQAICYQAGVSTQAICYQAGVQYLPRPFATQANCWEVQCSLLEKLVIICFIHFAVGTLDHS